MSVSDGITVNVGGNGVSVAVGVQVGVAVGIPVAVAVAVAVSVAVTVGVDGVVRAKLILDKSGVPAFTLRIVAKLGSLTPCQYCTLWFETPLLHQIWFPPAKTL